MWTKTFSPITFFLLALVLGGFYSVNTNAASYGSGLEACKLAAGDVSPSGSSSGCNNPAYSAVTNWFRAPETPQNPACTLIGTASWEYTATGYGGAGCTDETIPINPCVAKTGSSAIPSGKIAYGENAEGTSSTTARMCDADLCVIKINHGTTMPIGGGLQANYITNGTFTGEQASGSNNCPITVTANTPKDPDLPKPIDTVTPAADTPDGVPVLPTDCPPGSAFGSVNGVNVCAPSGSKISYQPDTSTQTNNGTTTTSSTQRTDTVNPDGSVTSEKTTTSTGSGGASSTTTTTTNNTNNTFGGGSSKEGDSKGIDLGPAPSAESGDVPAIPGIAPGTGQDGAGQAERTFTVGAHFSGAGSCIADRSVTVLGVTVTVPLSELCPWFDIMYKVVSIMATFAALRILVMA